MLRDKKEKDQFDKALGERVKYYRNLRGMTLADVSDITGYSGAYVNYIERAVNTPSSYVVWLFAQAFGVPVEKLYPHTEKDEVLNNDNDPILKDKDFQPYLELAKEAYLKKVNPKVLDQSVKILTAK